MEWYEELDYEENPFRDNEETELIGYEDVIDEVLYRLESGNMICVEGKEGAGKTAVLKAAINKFRGTDRLVYFNGQDMDNGLNIEKAFKKKAGFMKRIFNKKPKNLIVLFDEIQNISKKNCERLKYYYDNSFIKSAVFTSSNFNKANFTTSLKDRISKTIKLREMTEDEAVDVVQSRLGSDEIIPEEVIKEVFNKSSRNMKQFLKNCESLCKFALENNGKTVLPEHVKEVIKESEKIEESPIEEKKESQKKTNKQKKTRKTSNQKKNNPKKNKNSNQEKKEAEDPMLAVEEPVTVSVSSDFKPTKKEVKMKDEFEEEEIDIDSELKKLSKANQLEDEDLEAEDYEEDYDEFIEDDEDDEEPKKMVDEDEEDIAEKYY